MSPPPAVVVLVMCLPTHPPSACFPFRSGPLPVSIDGNRIIVHSNETLEWVVVVAVVIAARDNGGWMWWMGGVLDGIRSRVGNE